MIIYVIVIVYLITPLMNIFTSIVITTYFSSLTIRNPTCFARMLLCGWVPALVRLLICHMMREIHANY